MILLRMVRMFSELSKTGSVLPAWLLVDALGLTGIYLSFVTSSVGTLLAVFSAVPYYAKQNLSGILLQNLNAERNGAYISFGVNANTEDIVASLDSVEDFAQQNSLTMKEAMLIRMSLEEMMISIAQHALSNDEKETIDVRLLVINQAAGMMIVIRIRYCGRFFNPIDYYELLEEDDPLALGDALGIAMIVKAADAIHYKSTFGINNLTVIVDKKRGVITPWNT